MLVVRLLQPVKHRLGSDFLFFLPMVYVAQFFGPLLPSKLIRVLPIRLVLGGGGLASLELVKVPTADGQRTLVLIHAAAEVGDVGLASPWGLVL